MQRDRADRAVVNALRERHITERSRATGFSVSATCDPGEVAISGGVDVGNSFTTHTVESRRLDTDTWTVTLQTGANPDTATAEVYCLQV